MLLSFKGAEDVKNDPGYRSVFGYWRRGREHLLADGNIVYAGARRVERMRPLADVGARLLALDVTDDASMTAATETILREGGRIDVLVNSAGYGLYGTLEDMPQEEGRRQFEVNVLGFARLGRLEAIPADARGSHVSVSNPASLSQTFNEKRELLFVFRDLATLRIDLPMFSSIGDLLWQGLPLALHRWRNVSTRLSTHQSVRHVPRRKTQEKISDGKPTYQERWDHVIRSRDHLVSASSLSARSHS